MSISATEYQKRLQPLLNLSTLQAIVSELVIKDEATVKLLKEQDFLQGDIYGDGRSYATYRSKGYEQLKRAKNPIAGGKVDLINTGAFVDAMKLNQPRNGKYLFGNTDSKRNILKDIYGENIFGLNQNVFSKYQKDIIAPRFITAIKVKAKIS